MDAFRVNTGNVMWKWVYASVRSAYSAILLRLQRSVEIAAQGMQSLPWLSLVLSLERDPLVRDAVHASAGSARLLVP
jgi:hypothetical protein